MTKAPSKKSPKGYLLTQPTSTRIRITFWKKAYLQMLSSSRIVPRTRCDLSVRVSLCNVSLRLRRLLCRYHLYRPEVMNQRSAPSRRWEARQAKPCSTWSSRARSLIQSSRRTSRWWLDQIPFRKEKNACTFTFTTIFRCRSKTEDYLSVQPIPSLFASRRTSNHRLTLHGA